MESIYGIVTSCGTAYDYHHLKSRVSGLFLRWHVTPNHDLYEAHKAGYNYVLCLMYIN